MGKAGYTHGSRITHYVSQTRKDTSIMPTSLPIAVQLYTLRNLTMPFDQLLGEIAAIGYAGVETTSNHGLTAAEMNALLDKHGLQVCSAHVGLPKFETEFDEVIAFNQAIGNTMLVVPFVPEAARGQ